MDFYTACALGNVSAVMLTLQTDKSAVLRTNSKGWSGLMYACFYCRNLIVIALMKTDDRCVYVKNLRMQTALMLAVQSCEYNVVKLVLKESIVNHRDCNGQTALFYAAVNGKNEIITLLLKKGAHVNITDNEEKTALMRAAEEGKDNIVQTLLSQGARFSLKSDKFSQTPLPDQIPKDLNTLLRGLSLESYTSLFREKNIELEMFLQMNEIDLKKIGIKLLGPRRKMWLAIERITAARNKGIY